MGTRALNGILGVSPRAVRTLREQCAGHPVAYCARCRAAWETDELCCAFSDGMVDRTTPGALCPECGADLAASIRDHIEACENFRAQEATMTIYTLTPVATIVMRGGWTRSRERALRRAQALADETMRPVRVSSHDGYVTVAVVQPSAAARRRQRREEEARSDADVE